MEKPETVSDEKLYTISQLRGAWGAGHYSKKQSPPTPMFCEDDYMTAIETLLRQGNYFPAESTFKHATFGVCAVEESDGVTVVARCQDGRTLTFHMGIVLVAKLLIDEAL